MLQMPVHPDAIDHPIPCSICSESAAVIVFDKVPFKTGAIALKKKFARCASHLPTIDGGDGGTVI
jgi:hypothetical protein